MKTFVRSVSLQIAAVLTLALFSGCLLSARAGTETARVVKYGKEDIIPIRAKLRFSTLIVLPDNEEILDFTTGDKEFWIINGVHNLCYLHPAEAGIRSNLNLITASGHVYSFTLTEVSKEPNTDPDLKLFIEPKDASSVSSNGSFQGYVRAGEVEAYKKELETIRSETMEQIHSAQSQVTEQINKFRAGYQSKLHFDYTVGKKANHAPFRVSAIYHDDTFTYIQCSASEKPTLYEVKDGKPNLINFQLENGVYIAPKVLDNGYLAIGKKKLTFSRQISAN